MTAKDPQSETIHRLNKFASKSYTDGAARQTIYLAVDLLRAYRGEKYIGIRLALIVKRLTQTGREAFDKAVTE